MFGRATGTAFKKFYSEHLWVHSQQKSVDAYSWCLYIVNIQYVVYECETVASDMYFPNIEL